MTCTIPLPTITDADGKPECVFGIEFHVGNLDIEFTTDGCGAFIRFATDPCDDDHKVEMNASELTALAAWVESVCKAMDKHNGEDGKK